MARGRSKAGYRKHLYRKLEHKKTSFLKLKDLPIVLPRDADRRCTSQQLRRGLRFAEQRLLTFYSDIDRSIDSSSRPMRRLVTPHPSLTVSNPSYPGKSNILLTTDTTLLCDRGEHTVMSLQAGMAKRLYSGEYVFRHLEKLDTGAFSKLDESCQHALAAEVLSPYSVGLRHLRAKIARHQNVPDDVLAAGTQLTSTNVIDAFKRGDAHVYVVGMQCGSYDYEYHDVLFSRIDKDQL